MTQEMTQQNMSAEVDFASLTHEEKIAHNLAVVEAHFHNETPETIDHALALYGPEIIWEAPARGMVYDDVDEVREAYMAIFRTVNYNKTTSLRRFATEDFVFDDQVADLTVVGDEMPNLPFKKGDRISMRLVHCFEMKDGKIAREIAYEISRSYKGPIDNDDIPEGSLVEEFPDGPHFGQW